MSDLTNSAPASLPSGGQVRRSFSDFERRDEDMRRRGSGSTGLKMAGEPTTTEQILDRGTLKRHDGEPKPAPPPEPDVKSWSAHLIGGKRMQLMGLRRGGGRTRRDRGGGRTVRA